MRAGTCDRCGERFVDRSHAQKRRFCSENCRKRHCDETTYRGVCVDCGGPRGNRSKREGTHRCAECWTVLVASRHAAILAGYRDGKTPQEIARETGIPYFTVRNTASQLRRAGEDIPTAPRGRKSHRSIREAA